LWRPATEYKITPRYFDDGRTETFVRGLTGPTAAVETLMVISVRGASDVSACGTSRTSGLKERLMGVSVCRVRIFIWGLYVASLLALSPSIATAQESTGSIIGQLSDDSGAVLPGVTVTVTGPALQVPQISQVSDARGEYRVTGLPIGTYEVRYQLQGFEPVVRQGVRLTADLSRKSTCH
jgi:hypothetical protein